VSSGVGAVWRSRGVLRLLVQRDLTVKYQASVLGYLWSLIEPLAVAGTYWFVFGVLYDTRVGPRDTPYLLFLVSGLFAWLWIAGVLSDATSALTAQSRLITTIKVPREVFPIGRVLGKFVEYLAALPVLLLIALIYQAQGRYHLGASLLLLPLAIALQMVFLVGVALVLSSLNVLLRDVERFMRLIQRVLFYSVPVIYPLEKVRDAGLPRWAQVLYESNPIVGIIQLHHAAWIPGEFPSGPVLAVAVTGAFVLLVGGWLLFRRLEPAVLKEL
jgi:ABC-2 type transport system permease protein